MKNKVISKIHTLFPLANSFKEETNEQSVCGITTSYLLLYNLVFLSHVSEPHANLVFQLYYKTKTKYQSKRTSEERIREHEKM